MRVARHRPARARRIAGRERLLFFTGMNVTRTLPFGSEADVREEIDYVTTSTGGCQGLFLFTSSSISPEVPLRNIVCAYRHAAEGRCRAAASPSRDVVWPGSRRR
jgi:hypothetical protein